MVLINPGQVSIRPTEVGDMFGHIDTKHFREGFKDGVHTFPIDQIEIVSIDYLAIMKELTSHLGSSSIRVGRSH